MSEPASSFMEQFAKLLEDSSGRQMFADAIGNSYKTVHKNSRGPYNIDAVSGIAAAIESYNYASVHMVDKPRFADRKELLKFAAGKVTKDGPVLEFGVWSGTSINYLSTLFPSSQLYGFDSFEGLPEGWFGKSAGKGQFSLEGKLPKVRDNIELIKGWFDHSLPFFLDSHSFDSISLLHVDCDIYSSTQTVLTQLHNRIVPGTIIVFDEYFNYPTWQRHEFRAFQEYVNVRQVKYEYIGLVPSREQVAVRIIG